MDRSNHYEAAFEAYLRWHGRCYVAVDETRRAMLGESQVKSLDFLVFDATGMGLLVDVKGRRFPSGPADKPRRVWECWSAEEDVSGLRRWAEVFGPGFQGVLVFAYHVLPEVGLPEEVDDLWTWRGKRYLLRGVRVDDYTRHLRVRSPRWKTVYVPNQTFQSLARPFHSFLHPALAEECPF